MKKGIKKVVGIVAMGAGLYLLYRIIIGKGDRQLDRRDNLVPSTPIPELLMSSTEGGVWFGITPASCEGNKGSNKVVNRAYGKPTSKDGNVLIIGGPGSGKTTGPINHTLKTWNGSLVAFDCKGGMENLWYDLHADDGKAPIVFAPCRKRGGPSAYDPFAIMRLDPNHAKEYACDLADALIPISVSEREPVWKENAQNILTGMFLYHFDVGNTFMDAIKSIEVLSIPDMIEVLGNSGNERAWAFVSKLAGASVKTLASVGAELSQVSRLLLTEEIEAALTPVLGQPLLDWSDLNTSRTSHGVILDIPLGKLRQCAPLVRLVLSQLLKTLALRREKTYSGCDLPDVALLLDEVAQLGRMEVITDSLATLRSKGVTMVLAIQSLAQLEESYGKAAARIVADLCSYKVVFNATDVESQVYLSALIGTTDVLADTVSFNPKGRHLLKQVVPVPNVGVTAGRTNRPLIYPETLAYLSQPIVISPFGVNTVQKAPLYLRQVKATPLSLCVEGHDDSIYEIKKQLNEIGKQFLALTQPEACDCPRSGDYKLAVDNTTKERLPDKICDFCQTEPRSAREIREQFDIEKTLCQEVYIKPLLNQGRLMMLYPDTPRHPQQKYYSSNSPELTENSFAQLNKTSGKEGEEGENDDD